MSSYTALYRKWRPATFDEVIGQEAVCRTLKNQIERGRIGHAYLFCGTRGTGKTSIAKILARAVNCERQEDGNPCNQCPTCEIILTESSMNIIELDAASNNGVDDIRNIKEQVSYPPTEGKYKVFIIDEVHMLSAGAFNALLKTLEEPPEYVIFILATTEVHKIPITVLSRCQRYDLKRIASKEIAKQMERICQAENIDIEKTALEYIAKKSDGAMRDALSILDEMAVFRQNEKISYEDVLEVLGTTDISVFANLFEALARSDTMAALDTVEEVFAQGREPGQFIEDFLWYMRNILIVKSSDKKSNIIDLSEDNLNIIEKSAKTISKEALIRYIRLLAELSNRLRFAANKRIFIEISIIKICTPQMEIDADSIVERIAKLERKLDEAINADIINIQKTENLVGERQAEEAKTERIKKIKLPKAEFDDLVMLRKNWESAIDSLSGAGRSIFKNTYIEPAGEGEANIVFTNQKNYMFADQDIYMAELKAYINKNLQKEFVLHRTLRTETGEEPSEYVLEEELSQVINMDIEYE